MGEDINKLSTGVNRLGIGGAGGNAGGQGRGDNLSWKSFNVKGFLHIWKRGNA